MSYWRLAARSHAPRLSPGVPSRPPAPGFGQAEAILIAAFFVSRILYYWAGVRFQSAILWDNFQFIDVALLRGRLWESLVHFHMQPPLMNSIVGVLVKMFPESYALALHALYILLGLGSGLLVYRLMLHLDVGPRLALFLACAFIVSPGVALSENFPMYEYPMMFLLLAASAALYRLISRPGFWTSLAFFAALAALAWIRALYHLYFLIAFAAIAVWFVRRNRAAVLAGSALPLLSVAGLYLKNLLIFGFFGASSWLGFNLATITIHQLSMEERNRLIEAGRLAPIARIEAPSPAPEYAPYFPAPPPVGIPVLDQTVKSTGGMNTNALVYLKAAPLYRDASKQVLRAAPQAYLRSEAIAWFCYFLPNTDFFQFGELRRPIYSFDRFLNVALFGQIREASGKELRAIKAAGHSASLILYTGTALMLLCPVLLGWGGYLLWRPALTRPQQALLAFAAANILLIMFTTNLLSSFENNRYRFPTDCLYLLLLGTLIERFLRSRRAGAS